MSQGLLTTAVGSYPKPPYLQKARNAFAAGKLDAAELRKLELQATAEWMQFQDEIGVDVPVDGEMARGDMVEFFAQNFDGFAISGLVRSYGNRYYRKPIAVGPIRRKSDVTIEMYKYAQSLTDKPVKGMLTGPYTMVDWSFNEYYPSREAFVLAIAEVINEEALALQAAGAQYIQIDEPAISVRPDELELARRGLEIAARGLTAHTVTHICYGDFAAVYDELIKLPIDQIDLEMANSNYDLLDLMRKNGFPKAVGLGVVDVHNHQLESVEEVKRGIRLALDVLPADRIFVDPDCGLKTRTVEEAKDKMRVIAQAVREVRQEMGISAATR